MKRILSVLLALVMVIGMLPMSILSASAAEVSETMTVTATGGILASDSLSISWTSGNIGLVVSKGSSSSAIRTSDSDHFRMYVGNSVTFTCSAGNITKIVATTTGSSYATALQGSVGSEATVSGTVVTITPTASSETYTISSITKQSRVKSIEVTYANVEADGCAHANTETIAAVAATCTTAGNTEGTKCTDCGTVLEGNETIAALGHTNDEGVVTAPTCTTDGYTLYTCTVCGSSAKSDWVDATGHTYVDGICSVCNIAKPAGLDGKYYIAAIRSSGNYQYMTNDLGTASTQRYQIVDSGLTTLPESIETIVDAQVFELIASGDGYKIKTGDQYLGWTSGNSGTLVDEANAKVLTVENGTAAGSYTLTFAVSDTEVRYLSLNSNASNAYFAFYTGTQVNDLYLIPVVENTTDPEEPTDPSEPTDPELPVDPTDPTEPTEPEQPAVSSATISFADTTQRVSQDTSSQVWSNGGLTVTNNKSASTSDIIDSSNPVRFYKNSDLIFAFTGMTKIEVACNTAAYATALANSISDATVTVSVSDKIVTIVPNAAIDSYTVTLSGGQVRVDSITVTASTCEHNWGEAIVESEPTCTVAGVNKSTCTLCGEVKTETVPATGHTYIYIDGKIGCANCDYSQAITLTTIADAKAASGDGNTYYIKGIVTYVNGKEIYMEDTTGGILVYGATAFEGIDVGDELLVWDDITTYQGKIETNNTTADQYMVVSTGNTLPETIVTVDQITADTFGKRVVIENVTIGVLGTNNTALTDADGNSINIYKAPALSENINENDTVTVTAIVSAYNTTMQLLINPGTAATDVVETAAGEEEVVTTVTIAEAKVGTVGEYYQVEGTVTYVSGRNVYIQDATGGIVVYLTANAATTQVGDNVKAYGALKNYNGLIELDAVDETNAEFYSILSNGNTVDAQTVTIADLIADNTNEYLAEKITLSDVYVSHYSYNSSYKNVNYYLVDGNGNEICVYRVTVASEEECVVGGSIVTVEAVVSAYNGYQLVTTNDKITVTGTCAHETTELVNFADATCTEAGYTGDTMCTICQNYTVRGEEIPATGHNNTNNGSCSICNAKVVASIGSTYYVDFADAYAAGTGKEIVLLADAGALDAPITLTKDLYVDLNSHYLFVSGVEGTNYTVLAKDSATDAYEEEAWGSITITNATLKAMTGYVALVESDNEYSLHAYNLELTHVSLKPNADALGYKAVLKGDYRVLAAVKSYGFNMGVAGGLSKEASYTLAEGEAFDGEFTLRLKNIMAVNGGRYVINGSAFVVFNDEANTTTQTETHNTTMRETILTINDMTLTDSEKAAVYNLYKNYSDEMNAWFIEANKTNNIVSWAPASTEEVPAE